MTGPTGDDLASGIVYQLAWKCVLRWARTQPEPLKGFLEEAMRKFYEAVRKRVIDQAPYSGLNPDNFDAPD